MKQWEKLVLLSAAATVIKREDDKKSDAQVKKTS